MVAPVVPVPLELKPWRDELGPPWPVARIAPIVLAVIAFVVLYAGPIRVLAGEWWTNPDAGHGLLLFPVSLWLAWSAGLRVAARPNVVLGATLIIGAVLLRAIGGLAAEFFTQRFAIWLTVVGIVTFLWGFRQVLHWWLPISLLLLSIPLPATITNSLAVPLQFQASKLGTALIEWRGIPVRTFGNVIQIPDQTLFVAEACSGLRSLTALIALGVMIGGIWLRTVPARLLILALAIPIAIIVNGFRIFLTAFLMHFVSPELGTGFMHKSEGWAMFVLAFGVIGAIAMVIRFAETRFLRWRGVADA
ncbi:MAG TPA: exosortase/archaeosortase family protein [Gemmatimonadales bacterium]|nr:exosortase/archaeosortase family protein [Gemmatimonadales bacterium]